MSNTNQPSATVTIHYPLAGAYKGGRANLKAIRSHGSIDGGSTALCSTVKTELCDVIETSEKATVTDLCPRCAAKIAKLKAKRETAEQAAARIASSVLGMETLDTRRSDSLDFKEHAVWSIREALLAAYAAGRASTEVA